MYLEMNSIASIFQWKDGAARNISPLQVGRQRRNMDAYLGMALGSREGRSTLDVLPKRNKIDSWKAWVNFGADPSETQRGLAKLLLIARIRKTGENSLFNSLFDLVARRGFKFGARISGDSILLKLRYYWEAFAEAISIQLAVFLFANLGTDRVFKPFRERQVFWRNISHPFLNHSC